jgi:outer membrane protein assembly factor BamA
LFNQLSAGLAVGNEWSIRSNRKNIVKFPNVEYSYLYNQSDSFKTTLERNPYLRYSFNTALVLGASYGYTSTFVNARHPERQRTFRWNIEESGLLIGSLKLFNTNLRRFLKSDVEYTYVVAHPKSASIFRGFLGIGIPAGRTDTVLPFFKQYFGGGPNSMRAWPLRGIGPGSRALAPYNSADSFNFNDRTGDIRLEVNGEYRYNIAQIIPNSLVLKGALFIDVGNVWNFRNTNINGGEDSLQFKFKNLYKQLGVSAGTGFRLDFNYFLIRFDLGFRVKRPDIAENYGWQLPGVTFNNLFARGEEVPDPNDPGKTINDERYRKWRYENFNFTIGLSYPF